MSGAEVGSGGGAGGLPTSSSHAYVIVQTQGIGSGGHGQPGIVSPKKCVDERMGIFIFCKHSPAVCAGPSTLQASAGVFWGALCIWWYSDE